MSAHGFRGVVDGTILSEEPSALQLLLESQSVPFESLLSIEQGLTFDYASNIFAHAGLSLEKTQMRSSGLIDEGMYTNLAFMLSDQFPQGIKMAVFEDEFKSVFLDRRETSGSLLRQFDEAVAFADEHNGSGEFRDYPDCSVREVIANAIVHRDYAIDGSTLISMFNDCVTVSSIGSIVNGLAPDDLMFGVSSARNEKLVSLMCRLGYVGACGTGMARITGPYRDSLEKPSIETSTNIFKITLPKLTHQTIDPIVRKIITAYSRGDVFTRSDLQDRFGLSRSRANNVVRESLERGSIEQIGSGRSTEYRRL